MALVALLLSRLVFVGFFEAAFGFGVGPLVVDFAFGGIFGLGVLVAAGVLVVADGVPVLDEAFTGVKLWT